MLTACLIVAALAMPQDPAPGITRELAASRKQQVERVEYDLRFRLQPGADSVEGWLFLRFWLAEEDAPTQPVVLDWNGDELLASTVNSKEVALRRVHNHLVVPADALVRGVNGVHVRFRTKVAPTGTPLTVYRDQQDEREYFYTLLVPADAHGLFPCFDQPDLRARFRLELDLPEQWTAVANTSPVDGLDAAQLEGPPIEVRGKLWRFGQSKPLPTYLFAFACGPFATFEPRHPDVPGVTSEQPMRVLLRESRLDDLDRAAVVKLHHEGLDWLAKSFGVPYPFDKLDLVLLPGFPYGGMEHAGAIFYRETALVFDHAPTTGEQVRRSTLVYHELSHQWFGNLVTMKWFDDLWLKEGFATFYGYRAMAALEPGQRAWLRFLQGVKPRAYAVDATPGTTPVFQQLQNLADAKSAYGAIVYNKAPAVLRALFSRLGADVFQAGVKQFLEEHAFDNADWRDLARALESAARQDLGRWSERWLLAPSMPQVRVAWQADADGKVTAAAVTQRALGGDGTWPIDLELLVFDASGERRTVSLTTDAASASIDELVGAAAPAAVLANPQDIAYGQFVPDPISSAWLLENLPLERDPLVRASATAALYEAVREAELDPQAFAGLALRLLAAERDADTHRWLLSRLGTCLTRYLTGDRAAALQKRATNLLLQQLANEGGSGRELNTFRFLVQISRDDAVLALCRDVVYARELPQGLECGRKDCFLAAAALIAAGVGEQELTHLEDRFRAEDNGKEVFLARAATPTVESKQAYWQKYLVADDPPEQWTQDSLSYFHWSGQEALTMPYLAKALEQVDWVKQHRRIFFMPAWIDAFVNAHSDRAALDVVDAFLADHELSDDVRKKVLQSRDGLLRAVRVREAFAADEK